MEQSNDRSPPSAGLPAMVPATAPEARNLGALDSRLATDDYDWLPVRRNPRSDGWSPDRQRNFIEALADRGSVMDAAQQVGMSASSAYRLRRQPGGEAFAAAWDAAIHHAALHLVDVAFDRAIHGSDEPVFDKEGRRVGRKMRQNDRLLMFLLRAHLPDRYAHAHRAERPASAAIPAVTPVAQAIAAMLPAPSPEPAMLMPPDQLAQALDLADLYDGAIPRGLRDRDGPADNDDEDQLPLGAAFEAQLDTAKRTAAEIPPPDYDDEDEFEDAFEDDEEEYDDEDEDEDEDEHEDEENPSLA